MVVVRESIPIVFDGCLQGFTNAVQESALGCDPEVLWSTMNSERDRIAQALSLWQLSKHLYPQELTLDCIIVSNGGRLGRLVPF
jgi:hypothetical protein